jgi:hypothetical protein
MSTGVAVVNATVVPAAHLRPLVTDTMDGAYASVVFFAPRAAPFFDGSPVAVFECSLSGQRHAQLKQNGTEQGNQIAVIVDMNWLLMLRMNCPT